MKNISAQKMAGSNSITGRERNDFYATPMYATQSLLSRETFEGNVWEPACGTGAISMELLRLGYNVFSTDIADYGYGKTGLNFLKDFTTAIHLPMDNIITNPPFSDALAFVLQAKKFANRKIAMFMRTSFLEGKSRYEMFQDTEFPLKCIYQFSERVSFTESSSGSHKSGGMIPFAWFVWDKEHAGKAVIDWIKPRNELKSQGKLQLALL